MCLFFNSFDVLINFYLMRSLYENCKDYVLYSFLMLVCFIYCYFLIV